jgi:Domain of unknown function (DUF4867)
MDTLYQLQQQNPDIEILPVTHKAFTPFGRVLFEAKADQAIEAARKMWKLSDGVGAAASVPQFEADQDLQATIGLRVFAEMPVEVGWVFGRNSRLNGIEYHHGSEVHIPLEDCILLVADWREIVWTPEPSFDTRHMRAFYVPKGVITELKAWSLHFVPINVSRKAGFCNLFVLPQGTGEPLQYPKSDAPDYRIMIARNQWLMVHSEATDLVKSGNFIGLTGKNIEINQLD